ncbi:MAG TPA: hydroxymethylglutaryl-CoA lyase [Candidatus Dormibacteraeota bacterium]
MTAELAGAERIFFTEVGPRDGLQNLDRDLTTTQKLDLVKGALEAGASQVEATSFVSPEWVPKLADAEAVMAGLVADLPHSDLDRIRVLVPNRRGLERALRAGARRVIVNLGVTEAFNQRNLNRSVAETVTEIGQMAQEAVRAECVWDASLSVAFGCPFEGRVEPTRVVELAAELVAQGAREVSIADTIGVADPEQVRQLVELAAAQVPLSWLSLHLHDTRAMGLANALAGYRAGIRRFEGSVGGIGGCPFAPRSTGNVCSEDLLHLLWRVGAEIDVDLAEMCSLAQGLAKTLGCDLPGRLYRAGVWQPETAQSPA